MRKILLATTLFWSFPAMAQVVTPLPAGPFVEDHTDLFDVAVSGTTVIGGTGGFPGFVGEDAFGASSASSLEPGHYVFNDFLYSNQTQGLDFKTATAVTIAGFNLYLGSDQNGARQFDSIALSGSIDNVTFTVLSSFALTSGTYLNAYGSTAIRVQSTFAAGTYQYFRLAAHDRNGFEGGRILELDAIAGTATPGGVPEPATWAMLLVGFGGMGFALRRRPGRGLRVRYA